MSPIIGIINAVFPARAGMSRPYEDGPFEYDGVPRASGDEPQVRLRRAFVGGCSPRKRG